MIKLFKLSFRDFWTKKFILWAILPILLPLIALFSLLYFGGAELLNSLEIWLESGDISLLNNYPFLQKIVSFPLTKWLFSAIFYVASTFLILILAVVFATITVGFITPIITHEINHRHYNKIIQNEPNFWLITKKMLKEIGIFLLIFLAVSPLFFLPLLNLIAINIPLFYIYYKFMLIDVASNTLDEQNFLKTYKKGGGGTFFITTLFFYILCLVPFVGLLGQIYFVICLSHIIYKNQK